MHMPKNTFSKKNYEIAIFTRFYLIIGYLKATVVHIRVTLGHLRVTIGYFFL